MSDPINATAWPFGDLRPRAYGVILADPPWLFKNYSILGNAKNPVSHYACMSLADIAALPVAELAAADCVLFMWGTAPMLDVQIDVLKAWGFVYKTFAAWAKESKTGNRLAFGPGYIFRNAAEIILVGTRGKFAPSSRRERNLIWAPVREHSRKPEAAHAMIERMTQGARRVELFARARRPGWDVWGNQVDKFQGAA